MTDKSELLDQLKIDRTEESSSGLSAGAAIAIALVAALLGAGGSWWLLSSKMSTTDTVATPPAQSQNRSASTASDTATPAATTTTPEPPSESASDEILNASGYITARRIATVSSEIMGLITEVNVEEGMLVEQGQVLAKLDDALAAVNLRLAQSQLRAQIAQRDSAAANLAEAQRVLSRSKDLRSKSLTSEAELTRSTASVESQQAQLASANANISVSRLEIERQQERLSDHVIRAPFAGVVTVKNAQTGEIVSPSSAGGGFTRTGICTIVDMASLEIEVDVNEAFIGRVFPGQRVQASLDAYPNWKIPATVIAVIPTADRAKATVRVRISIDEKDQRILPDMGVKVAFLRA